MLLNVGLRTLLDVFHSRQCAVFLLKFQVAFKEDFHLFCRKFHVYYPFE